MSDRVRVWDPFVRIFHWSLVILFTLNALLIDEDSSWHVWIGYGVAALIAARLVWGMIGSRYARFSSFPPSVAQAREQVADIVKGRNRPHTGHTPLGAWMIYNLLLTLAVIAGSGYLMTTDMFWGIEWMEGLHEAAVTWAEISVIAHIAAVLFESHRTHTNLPRAMITGYKEPPLIN